jgi:uncharacterized membrane protein
MLPILMLILLVLGLFGLLKAHDCPWGPQTNILYFICIVLVVIYLFHAIWGLNHLDFSGYYKIKQDIAHVEAHIATLGAFWPLKDLWGAPWHP